MFGIDPAALDGLKTFTLAYLVISAGAFAVVLIRGIVRRWRNGR